MTNNTFNFQQNNVNFKFNKNYIIKMYIQNLIFSCEIKKKFIKTMSSLKITPGTHPPKLVSHRSVSVTSLSQVSLCHTTQLTWRTPCHVIIIIIGTISTSPWLLLHSNQKLDFCIVPTTTICKHHHSRSLYAELLKALHCPVTLRCVWFGYQP